MTGEWKSRTLESSSLPPVTFVNFFRCACLVSGAGALIGPEGLWGYNISGTNYSVVVAFSVPWNDLLFEEKFNVKVTNHGSGSVGNQGRGNQGKGNQGRGN